MSQFDEVIERLLVEPAFKDEIVRDPATALAPYRLTTQELTLLASRLDLDAGTTGGVETRQSKSAMFGLLAQAVDLINEP